MSADDKDTVMPFPWSFVAVATGAVFFQILAGFVIHQTLATWTERSSFGEMFGAVNCLFSGLALAGVIYTIAIQREELRLQRQELVLTRNELHRAAAAQEKHITMQSMREILTEMDHKDAHAARNYVYRNRALYASVASDPSKIADVPADAYATACVVSNSFDRVGVFVSEGLIPKEIVLRNFGDSIARSWVALRPFIAALRKSQYNARYEKFFEELAQDAIRTIGLDEVERMLTAWGSGRHGKADSNTPVEKQ